ncbi:MAG TPA: sulfatase-like hydrolase/transferase [Myxococcota bacterium]|nr:sulfatase-like hydrolase/transferase [Myxococcota bacterium]
MRWGSRGAASLVVACLLAGCVCSPEAPEEPPRRGRRAAEGHEPQLVLLIVMDTVRADHTSLCGYERPTTPTLEAIARSGAAHVCSAYAPAPWTLPSHATYFTGKPVTEHATMFVANSDVSINATITARPLADEHETLAETFLARGYQTVAISANSIINEASGLLQGFEHKDVSTDGKSLRARGMGQALRAQLATLDPDRPLFLFVNLYDAHDPYPGIPPGLGWAPAQGKARLDAYTKDPANPYFAYIKDLMPEAEKPAFLERLVNGYDYGVLHADANVSIVLSTLLKGGWMEGGYRVVVTSDHGELLGEHELLRHSGFVWEPGVKVPLLFIDSARRGRVRLPDPISGLHVYHLLRDGHLPDTLIPPHCVSEKNPDDILVGTIAGAVWSPDGTTKAACVDGVRESWDLTADPTEAHPQPAPADGHLAQNLDKLCGDVEALHRLPVPKVDRTLTEALMRMGYTEDDDDADEAVPLPAAQGFDPGQGGRGR